jgi:lysine-specific demethylase 3
MTSLFSSSWMCRLCGREACAECFEQVKNLTEDRSETSDAEKAVRQLQREKHSHSNPFFLSCTRRNEHHARDFSPMSRFCKTELADAINEMEALLNTPDIDALPVVGAIDPTLAVSPQENGPSASPLNGYVPELTTELQSATDSTGVPTPPEQLLLASLDKASSDGQIDPALVSVNPEDIPSYTPRYFTDAELTDDVFRPMWERGEPLVVTGLLPKFKIKWTPEYFMEKYESQSCLILECQSDGNKRITVGEFFSWFGKYEGREESWKLKVRLPDPRFCLSWLQLCTGLAPFYRFQECVPGVV